MQAGRVTMHIGIGFREDILAVIGEMRLRWRLMQHSLVLDLGTGELYIRWDGRRLKG